MAIARKPNRNTLAGTEQAAAAFIEAAVKAPPAPQPAEAEVRKTPIMLRFDVPLLRRVDAAAKRRGISRSAWIAFKVSEALDAEAM